MASERDSKIQREASLRRIAIVLSSLPPATAAHLMGSIDGDSKRAVRRTMATLADVDPLERKRAIQAFKVSLSGTPTSSSGPATSFRAVRDEVAISPAPGLPTNTTTGNSGSSRVVSSSQFSIPENSLADDAATSSLSFLAKVDDVTLVDLLSKEHSQTIAMVLASMDPSHAARVLPQLESTVQTEALSRIGRLSDVSKETVSEVAQHFKNRVASFSERTGESGDPTGKRALDAILAAMPSSSRPAMQPATPAEFSSSHQRETELSRKLRDAELESPHPTGQAVEQSPRENTLPPSLRVVHSDGHSSDVDAAPMEDQPALNSSYAGATKHNPVHSTDSIHAFLLEREPAELCQALGKVETQTAMLALCGLPIEISNAVLAVLPKATARKVRTKMATLGSLQLREIDEAKEVIARLLVGDPVKSIASTSEPVPVAA